MKNTIQDRLALQINFLRRLDDLKGIDRRTLIISGRRKENSSEHSWHLAMCALILGEHAAENVDLFRAIAILLVHDIVEIESGDTFCYGTKSEKDQLGDEAIAAESLFSSLPSDQREFCLELWHEFAAQCTPTARFAQALDRFQPLLVNYFSGGKTWQAEEIQAEQVRKRNEIISREIPPLKGLVEQWIAEAETQGWLKGAG